MNIKTATLLVILSAFDFPGHCASAQVEADIAPQIIDLTQQIQKSPRKAELYLSRGDLYRAQQKWDAAQADFDYAFGIDPRLDQIDFLRGRMFLEANWPVSAKLAFDRVLSKQPDHLEALLLRARALAKLESRVVAAKDYTRVIQLTTESRPELYIERAQVLAAEGGPNVKEALKGLDEGIKKLGPLVTLQSAAIDIELRQKLYDDALVRVEKIASTTPRKETWLARKGEILQQAGRSEDARAAFTAALQAIDSLPPGRKNVPAIAELQSRIRERLQSLKSSSTPAVP